MAMNKYLSIITLNVNGLNALIKRHYSGMDKKTRPTHMLPTRDTSQDKRPTQTESEGLETNFPSKWTGKKARVVLDLKMRAIKTKGHFIILKGRIHQEDINFVNIYAPNI